VHGSELGCGAFTGVNVMGAFMKSSDLLQSKTCGNCNGCRLLMSAAAHVRADAVGAVVLRGTSAGSRFSSWLFRLVAGYGD